jgi:putative ABC transport system permease protein
LNLAWRDIRHKLGRFVMTCLGLSLLLAVVVAMAGIYRGQTADALALAEAINADLWIVEAGTHGPFAESSRIAGDTREMVARIDGVAEAGSITLQNVQLERSGRKLRLQVVGYEPGRPGGLDVSSRDAGSRTAITSWSPTARRASRLARRCTLAAKGMTTRWSA